ncbi:MAG: hypothetical protein ACLRSW_10265 [Christensenellaceae bacterium]
MRHVLTRAFDCPLTENDRAFLRDAGARKCSFTYVAVSEGQVVGFIIGHWQKDFDKSLAKTHDAKPHRRGRGAFSSPSGL